MATLERFRFRRPKTRKEIGNITVILDGRHQKTSLNDSESQRTEAQRDETWIRGVKVKLQLIFQRGSSEQNPALVDIVDSATTDAGGNTTSKDVDQQQSQWTSEVPVSSSKVYCIPKTNIFVGLPSEIPVPPEAKAVFEQKVKALLLADLDQARKYIESTSPGRRDPNSYIFEPVVLRMSGRAASGRDGAVKLSPTIWVRYSPAQRQSMQKAIGESCMKWAHKTEFGEIMVENSARLLSSNQLEYQVPAGVGAPLDGLGGFRLYLEIEDPLSRKTLPHGTLCRATIMDGSAIFSQNLSRIGGLITVDGNFFGLTTAHGILGSVWDMLWNDEDPHKLSLPPTGEPPQSFTGDPPSKNTQDGGSTDDISGDDYTCYADFTVKSTESTETKQTTKWVEVQLRGVANFLGVKALPGNNPWTDTPTTIVFVKDVLKSDFALIGMDSAWELPVPMEPAAASAVRGVYRSGPLLQGPVEVDIGEELRLNGLLLSEPASLDILGVSLPTRIIQLAQPLGPGTSGAWVVRDDTLCGMIIAGYEDEPFAHMIPATQLVKDIEESTSSRVGLFQSRPSNEDSPLDGRSKLPRNRREPVPADYFPPLGLSNYGNPRTTKTSAIVISEKQPQTPPNDGIEPVSHLSGLPNKGKQKEKEESRAQPTDTTENDPPHESRPAIATNANEMKGIRLGMVVAALCAAEFVVTLTENILPGAVPRMTADFHSLHYIAWYASAYRMAYCISDPTWKRGYELNSRKVLYLMSLITVGVGSAVCATVNSSVAFIVGRFIAGLGAPGILYGGSSISAMVFPQSKGGFYMRLALAVRVPSIGVASVLGGVLTDRATWRWCFYINLPIVGFVLAVAVLFLPVRPGAEDKSTISILTRMHRYDPLGKLFMLGFMICLVSGLQLGSAEVQWSNQTVVALLCLSGIFFQAFVVSQIWSANYATIPPSVARQRKVACGVLIFICWNGACHSMLYWLPLWFQAVQGTTALKSGVNTLPLPLSFMTASFLCAVIDSKTRRHVPWILCGGIFMSVGAGMVTRFDMDTPSATWIGYQVLFGVGAGFVEAVRSCLITDKETRFQVMPFASSVGAVVSAAVWQAIFSNSLRSGLQPEPGIMDLIQENGASELAAKLSPHVMDPGIVHGFLRLFNGAMRDGMYAVVVAASLMAIPAVLAKDWKRRGEPSDQEREQPPSMTETA